MLATAALAIAMLQRPELLPEHQRGSYLVSACRSFVRILDSTSDASVSGVEIGNGNYCMGYFDGMTAYVDSVTLGICFSGPITTGTLARVYVLFMDKHPKAFDTEKSLGAYAALREAYPCRK